MSLSYQAEGFRLRFWQTKLFKVMSNHLPLVVSSSYWYILFSNHAEQFFWYISTEPCHSQQIVYIHAYIHVPLYVKGSSIVHALIIQLPTLWKISTCMTVNLSQFYLGYQCAASESLLFDLAFRLWQPFLRQMTRYGSSKCCRKTYVTCTHVISSYLSVTASILAHIYPDSSSQNIGLQNIARILNHFITTSPFIYPLVALIFLCLFWTNFRVFKTSDILT